MEPEGLVWRIPLLVPVLREMYEVHVMIVPPFGVSIVNFILVKIYCERLIT